MAALGASLVGLSCGGGERDNVAGPAPAQPPTASTDTGAVTESAQPQMVQVCHYDATTGSVSDISLPEKAVKGHLGHGDVLGACAPAACPCFEAADLAQTCGPGATLFPTCPDPKFSFNAFCGDSECGQACPPSSNLGLRQVNPTERSCRRDAWDPSTGDYNPVSATNLSGAEVAACKSLIVSSPYYPTSCPQ